MKKIIYAACILLLLSCNAYAADGAVTEELIKGGSSWDGSALSSYPSGSPEVRILKITIPPGVELPMHKHPVINAAFMLSGELTVITDDNNILHPKAGDAFIEVQEKWHYGKNEGTSPAVLIVFYAGTKDSPITIKK
jgi:quercetin dioxygenase-like cupin family protein